MPDLATTPSAVGNGRPSVPPKRVMLTFGAITEAQVTKLLEQQMAAVWAAALESHGYDWREGWAIKFDDLRLERVGPPPTSPSPPGQG